MDQMAHMLSREMGLTRSDMVGNEAHGFPLVSAQAEFLAPARLEDQIEVRVFVTRLGRSSLSLRHEIVRLGPEDVLLARASESRVHVRRTASGTMAPEELSPAMRAVLERYLEPPDSHAAARE
jgi:acyl-CoA thioesterase FadM